MQVEGRHHLQDVLDVAFERAVALAPVGAHVRGAGTHVVHEHHPVPAGETGGEAPPEGLVHAEPVAEEHGRVPGPQEGQVVARDGPRLDGGRMGKRHGGR